MALVLKSLLQPARKSVEVIHIDAHQGIMRAGPLASRTAHLLDAKVTFGRLADWFHFAVHHDHTLLIANLHHANGFVGTVVEAGFAADACDRVNDHFATDIIPMNGTR